MIQNQKLCFACKSSLKNSPELISIAGLSHRWHPECFKCSVCSEPMDRERSCHLFREQIVCQEDYEKLRRTIYQRNHKQDTSPVKCAKCRWQISSADWVRKAADYVYHLACFNCDICFRQFNTGDQFVLDVQSSESHDGLTVRLLCRCHFSPTKATRQEQGDPTIRMANKRRHNESDTTSGRDSLIISTSQTIHPVDQLPSHARQLARRVSLSPISGVDFCVPSLHSSSQAADRSEQSKLKNLQQLMIDQSKLPLDGSIRDDFPIAQVDDTRSPDRCTGNFIQLSRGHTSSPILSPNSTQISSSTTSSPNGSIEHSNLSNAASSSLMLNMHQALPSPSSSSGVQHGNQGSVTHCNSGTKSKRVRTTFTDDQLSILQTHFQIDSNPDGQDLERIATITGLSKRVTQVWFQNSRARQKKYLVRRKPTTGHSQSQQQVGNNSNTSSNNSNDLVNQHLTGDM